MNRWYLLNVKLDNNEYKLYAITRKKQEINITV